MKQEAKCQFLRHWNGAIMMPKISGFCPLTIIPDYSFPKQYLGKICTKFVNKYSSYRTKTKFRQTEGQTDIIDNQLEGQKMWSSE